MQLRVFFTNVASQNVCFKLVGVSITSNSSGTFLFVAIIQNYYIVN